MTFADPGMCFPFSPWSRWLLELVPLKLLLLSSAPPPLLPLAFARKLSGSLSSTWTCAIFHLRGHRSSLKLFLNFQLSGV